MTFRPLLVLLAAAVSLGCLVAPSAVAAEGASRPQLALPAPTGPFPVGKTTRHLRDESRADFWVPQERRELMVSLWYPALLPTGRRAPYVTPAESAALVQALKVPGVPADVLTTVRTHASVDAPPLPRPAPLVVLSPGVSLPRATLTALGEDLASRGYLVAAVDHNHEAIAITFPDGRTTGCLACGSEDGAGASRNRAADVSFVLDQLTGPDAWPGQRVEPRRIAMVGHSLGGASAIAAMRADDRLRAGINLDGRVHVQPDGLDRPFLLLGTPDHQPAGRDRSWDDAWSGLTGWKRWLTVSGTGHNTFTDHPLLAEQLGMPLPEGQTMPARRGTEITRTYVAAFVDRHLRAGTGPLLDRPSYRYPEVRHWH
ncbi:alpha/beta hydrolase family protein [Amycolatopsis nigrescens]|uniref:alpha/beta hydrolase family protein n=1 Tax=Amycolatopsis nigrescens TaxID=381445 RepID=UPI00036B5D1D|nr:alpha/beta hydrolase [Amycolatopsis nigrescens]